MGKLFKIIVWIIVLTVIYIWFSTVLKSCKSDSSVLEDVTNVAEDFTEDIEQSIPDIDGETFEAEGDYDDGSDNTIEEQELDYSSEDELADLESALQDDVEETPPPERYTRSTSTSSGQYMIIAGNYLVESNATEMNSKLRNLGYDSAEVAIFDQSQYHTVIASRYDSYSDAIVAASNLKEKGIDCYVKKKS